MISLQHLQTFYSADSCYAIPLCSVCSSCSSACTLYQKSDSRTATIVKHTRSVLCDGARAINQNKNSECPKLVASLSRRMHMASLLGAWSFGLLLGSLIGATPQNRCRNCPCTVSAAGKRSLCCPTWSSLDEPTAVLVTVSMSGTNSSVHTFLGSIDDIMVSTQCTARQGSVALLLLQCTCMTS